MKSSEEKIMELSLSSINLKIQASLLMLIKNCYEMVSKEDGLLPPDFKKPTQFIEIEHELFTAVANLEENMKNKDSLESMLDSLKPIEERILSLATVMLAYNRSADDIFTLIKYESINLPETALPPLSDANTIISRFILECEEYLSANAETNNSPAENVKSMATLLKYIPLKMTKGKYNDYLGSCLSFLFKELENEEQIYDSIEFLKYIYLPMALENENIKTLYPDYFNILKEYYSEDFSKKTSAELDEIMETVDIIREDSATVIFYMEVLYESLIFVKLLCLLSKDLEQVFGDNILYKDFYYTLRDNIFSDELELYHAAAKENLIESIENLIDTSLALQEKLNKKLESADTSAYSDDSKLVLGILYLVDELYYDELNQHIPFVPHCTVSSADPADMLIDFIKTEEANFSPRRKKELKQLFLSNLPCTMTSAELFDYIQYSLSSLSMEKLPVCVVNTLQEIDMLSEDESEDDEDFDEDFDEDCGDENCDHEHHHHH